MLYVRICNFLYPPLSFSRNKTAICRSGRHKKDLTARLFTRWAVALIPEVRTLLAYYSDAGTLKLYRWAQGVRVEREETV